MSKVADILRSKGRTVHRISGDATIQDAALAMVHHDVGALVVANGAQTRGIFTERDCLRRVVTTLDELRARRVESVMTTEVAFITPDTTVDECMEMMTEYRLRHLPVMQGQHLVGIVSIGDIVKWLIRDQASFIESLTGYIQGRA